jgi:5-formyltetrahydrofolate cyclo-ligase
MKATLDQAKAKLREEMRLAAHAHSPAERAAASSAICERLKNQHLWQNAETVLLFSPLPDEPDIRSLMADALALGKIVTLPRFVSDAQQYAVCRVEDIASLHTGQFGILEPCSTAAIFDLKRLDFVLVPGVGFTLNGRRLGRGKGYYDRMLAAVRGTKCGVAFDWQLTVEIPVEPHDILFNYIVTPSLWHKV